MAGVNKAIIVGNIGQDPKVTQTQSGKTVARFTVATSKKYKQQDGSMAENTQWHNIVAWNKLGEVVRDYCHKGSKVYVEGEIETRSYQKDEETKYITEIIASSVQLLDKKSDNQSTQSQGYQQGYGQQAYGQQQSAYGQQAQAPAYGQPAYGQQYPSPNGGNQAPAPQPQQAQANYQQQPTAQPSGYCPTFTPTGITPCYDEQGRPLNVSVPSQGNAQAQQEPGLDPFGQEGIPF